jgi:large subunit ribosomal protein L25
MNSFEADIRNSNTKGEINKLRDTGFIPCILYGGKEANQKISINKKKFKILVKSENFLSNVLNLNIAGKEEKVLPREVEFDPVSDEPLHVDFLRIVKGGMVVLEIPVKFINNEKSPGLKKGGVLNIVRRKVELKCPTENIPLELVVDLDNTEIGTSIKISSIKLPEKVKPTIQGRDFVIATVASPTVVVEPEKPTEETAVEGEAAATEEGAAPTDGETKTEDKDQKPTDAKPDAKKEPSKK